MTGVKRTRRGVVVSFDEVEASLLRHLVGEVRDLLSGDGQLPPPADRAGGLPTDAELSALTGMGGPEQGDGNTGTPADPALARLLPDAYRDDPEAAGEFRRYTELSLRDGKVAAARTVLGTLPARGGRIRLSQPDAEAWLRALNDVRLALGVRLGVTDDFEEVGNGINPADPRAAYVWVYHWLAYLQESLVEALS